MFANSKLHYYSITAAIAAAVGLLAVFVATGFIFTSDLSLIHISEPTRPY